MSTRLGDDVSFWGPLIYSGANNLTLTVHNTPSLEEEETDKEQVVTHVHTIDTTAQRQSPPRCCKNGLSHGVDKG